MSGTRGRLAGHRAAAAGTAGTPAPAAEAGPAGRTRSPAGGREEPRARWRPRPGAAAAVLFAILALAYAFSIDIRASRGAAITGDEPFYLLTTQSLLEDGDLDLRQQYERESYRVFFDHPDGLWLQSVPAADGRVLSPHNPGLSVLLIPGFALAGLRGAQVELLLLAALTFALTYLLVARVAGEPLWSWLATLVVGLSATAFIYSTEIYPEAPAALALVLALLALEGGRAGAVSGSGHGSAARRAPVLGPGRVLWVAGALTAMMWLGVKYAPLVVLVGLAALRRAGPAGRWILVAAGMLMGAVYVWFHVATFGGLTPYGVNVVYAGDSTVELVGEHLDFATRFYRLWGLYIDERFGVGRWAPVLLLAVPGFAWLARRPGVPRLALALMGAQHLMATFVAITMMGWWFPGRTLMTVLPLYALPLACLLRESGWRGRVLFGALAAWSLAITAALARAGHAGEITVAVDPFELRAPVFRAAAVLFPNYTSWTPETYGLTAAWLVAGALALWRAWRLVPDQEPGTGPRN